MRVMVTGAGAGILGLALLLFESFRALSGSVYGDVAISLLWAGVGLLGVAGALLLGWIITAPASSTQSAPSPGSR